MAKCSGFRETGVPAAAAGDDHDDDNDDDNDDNEQAESERYQKEMAAWNKKIKKMGVAEKIAELQEKVSMLKKKSK